MCGGCFFPGVCVEIFGGGQLRRKSWGEGNGGNCILMDLFFFVLLFTKCCERYHVVLLVRRYKKN